MSYGRIHCLLFATRNGEVIYERFYDRLSELEKADIRRAFCLASSNLKSIPDDSDHIGAYRCVLLTLPRPAHAVCPGHSAAAELQLGFRPRQRGRTSARLFRGRGSEVT